MKNKECLSRYILIIRRLQHNQKATFEDIEKCLNEASMITGEDYTISKRTFQRDIKAINEIFKTHITHSQPEFAYYIDEESCDPEYTDKLIEHLEIFHSLKMLDNIKGIFHFDNRKPLGTQHLSQMIAAIKNRQQIHLTYNKNWDNNYTERILLPLLLKEFKGRWYVLAKWMDNGKVHTYALDRVVTFSLLDKHCTPPEGVAQYFDNSFGIFCKDDLQPEEVVLHFTKEAGRFVKEATMHSSQEIISETEIYLTIRLHLLVTLDFIMELRAYGESIEVLSPQHLRDEMRERLQKAADMYK